MATAAVELGPRRCVWEKRRMTMEPLAWLGVLAVIIGVIGVVVLVKGWKKPQ